MTNFQMKICLRIAAIFVAQYIIRLERAKWGPSMIQQQWLIHSYGIVFETIQEQKFILYVEI